jgi:hypothetical protein
MCTHVLYIHHIGITILLFFLHIFHFSWQAGWPRPIPSDKIISAYRSFPSLPYPCQTVMERSRILLVYLFLFKIDENLRDNEICVQLKELDSLHFISYSFINS